MDEHGLRDRVGVSFAMTGEIERQDDLVFSVDGGTSCVPCLRGPQTGAAGFKVDDPCLLERSGSPGIVPALQLACAHRVPPQPGCSAGRHPPQRRAGARQNVEAQAA